MTAIGLLTCAMARMNCWIRGSARITSALSAPPGSKSALYCSGRAWSIVRSTGTITVLSKCLNAWMRPSCSEMTSTLPPAWPSAFAGSVSSDSSKPSVARIATLKLSRAAMLQAPHVDSGELALLGLRFAGRGVVAHAAGRAARIERVPRHGRIEHPQDMLCAHLGRGRCPCLHDGDVIVRDRAIFQHRRLIFERQLRLHVRLGMLHRAVPFLPVPNPASTQACPQAA